MTGNGVDLIWVGAAPLGVHGGLGVKGQESAEAESALRSEAWFRYRGA